MANTKVEITMAEWDAAEYGIKNQYQLMKL